MIKETIYNLTEDEIKSAMCDWIHKKLNIKLNSKFIELDFKDNVFVVRFKKVEDISLK